MKICFSARAAYQIVSPMIFDAIHAVRQDSKAVFITDNLKNQRTMESHGAHGTVLNIASFIEVHWTELNIETFKQYAQKYACEPIWQYIYTDRFLIKRPYLYSVKIASGLFMFYESIFCGNEFDFYYDETIATLQSYIAYIVGKANNVKYIGQMTFRKVETKYHYFVTDPFQYMDGFDSAYPQKEYSEEIIKAASDYLEGFEKSQSVSDIMAYVKQKPKLEFKWTLWGIWLFLHKEYHNPCDYINYQYYKYFLSRTNYYTRYLCCKKYYNKPDFAQKYVYFPLHYQPEASTIVCAQKYEKQLFYIDQLAKSLPSDTVLYVKEHYALIGNRDMSFYKQLRNYPNVLILGPFQSSVELILHAEAVTTLTGTAGWEAMLLRKPVFLCGKTYFDNAPGIIKIDDIYLKYISIMQKWVKPERSEVLLYLCECISNIGEGCVYFSRKEFRNKDNINKVASSLLHQLEKMEISDDE